jgi:hypothetical protein
MAGKFSRSWQIFKSSAAVLGENKKLLVFPLFSSVATVIVLATFVSGFFLLPGSGGSAGGGEYASEVSSAELVMVFAMYLTLYFVAIFFNTALVASVARYLDGGDASVRYGLGAAWSRVGTIFGYAIIAATVGMLLKALEERLGFIGRIVVNLVGLAWTVSTFLVVPVLVHQNVGPIDAVKKSASMLKNTWGENIIANAGMGLVFMLLYIPIIALIVLGIAVASGDVATSNVGGANTMIGGSLLVMSVAALLLLGLTHAALQSIYGAALYRHASGDVGGSEGRDFSSAVLDNAFGPKKKK